MLWMRKAWQLCAITAVTAIQLNGFAQPQCTHASLKCDINDDHVSFYDSERCKEYLKCPNSSDRNASIVDLQATCICPPGWEGAACNIRASPLHKVVPGGCPRSKVWDGTFLNVASKNKYVECYFEADQSGLGKMVVEQMNNARINTTIRRDPTSGKDAVFSIDFSVASRFNLGDGTTLNAKQRQTCGTGELCCGPSHQWLTCRMSSCRPVCGTVQSAPGDQAGQVDLRDASYRCDVVSCESDLPEYVGQSERAANNAYRALAQIGTRVKSPAALSFASVDARHGTGELNLMTPINHILGEEMRLKAKCYTGECLPAPAPAPAPASTPALRQLQVAEPGGLYKGNTVVLTYNIMSTIVLDREKQELDFEVEIPGKKPVSCQREPYSYGADRLITLQNLDNADNCVTQSLQNNKLALKAFRYSPPPSDTADAATSAKLVVTVAYEVLPGATIDLDLDLDHVATTAPTPTPTEPPTEASADWHVLISSYEGCHGRSLDQRGQETASQGLAGSSGSLVAVDSSTTAASSSASLSGSDGGEESRSGGSGELAHSWVVFILLLVLIAGGSLALSLLGTSGKQRRVQAVRLAEARLEVIDFAPRSSCGYGIVFSNVTYDVKDKDKERVHRRTAFLEQQYNQQQQQQASANASTTAKNTPAQGKANGKANGTANGKANGKANSKANGKTSNCPYPEAQRLRVVDKVSGYAKPGQLVAILGPSGCGKSSLLDILAGRPKLGAIGGEIRITTQDQGQTDVTITGSTAAAAGTNIERSSSSRRRSSSSNRSGRDSSRRSLGNKQITDGKKSALRRTVCYLSQEDPATLLPTETVLETLLFSALMRVSTASAPTSASTSADGGSDKSETNVRRAYQLLHALKLAHVTHTKVGRLSGGERRRLSLGVELVTNPDCLLCDEVTSALDSKSCDVVLDLLQSYTQQGHCALVTIHQPSTRLLRRFTSLLLLSPGGQQLYFGPTTASNAGFGVERVGRIIAAAQVEFKADSAHTTTTGVHGQQGDFDDSGQTREKSSASTDSVLTDMLSLCPLQEPAPLKFQVSVVDHTNVTANMSGGANESQILTSIPCRLQRSPESVEYTAAEKLLELAGISPALVGSVNASMDSTATQKSAVGRESEVQRSQQSKLAQGVQYTKYTQSPLQQRLQSQDLLSLSTSASSSTGVLASRSEWSEWTPFSHHLQIATRNAKCHGPQAETSLWREGGELGERWCAAVRTAVLADGFGSDGSGHSSIGSKGSISPPPPPPHSHQYMLATVDAVLAKYHNHRPKGLGYVGDSTRALIQRGSRLFQQRFSRGGKAGTKKDQVEGAMASKSTSVSAGDEPADANSSNSNMSGYDCDDPPLLITSPLPLPRDGSNRSGNGNVSGNNEEPLTLLSRARESDKTHNSDDTLADSQATNLSMAPPSLPQPFSRMPTGDESDLESGLRFSRSDGVKIDQLVHQPPLKMGVVEQRLCAYRGANSNTFTAAAQHQHHKKTTAAQLLPSKSAHGSSAGFWTGRQQFWLLFCRSGRQWLRDPSLLAAQLALVSLGAGMIGSFAHGLPRDFPGSLTRIFLFNFMVLFFSLLGMSSIGTLVQDRHVFARERASGFYSTATYALAKILVCDLLPLRVLPPLLFGSLVYGLVGLSTEPGTLSNFLLVLVLVNVAASSLCILLSAACRDVSTANLFAAAFFLYSYMFSGLFMAGATGPAANIKYTSILFYAWEALFANEFRADSEFLFNPAGVSVLQKSNIELTGSILLDNFALRRDRVLVDMLALVVFTAVVQGTGSVACERVLVSPLPWC